MKNEYKNVVFLVVTYLFAYNVAEKQIKLMPKSLLRAYTEFAIILGIFFLMSLMFYLLFKKFSPKNNQRFINDLTKDMFGALLLLEIDSFVGLITALLGNSGMAAVIFAGIMIVIIPYLIVKIRNWNKARKAKEEEEF